MASRLASTMTNYTGFALKPKSSSATVTRFETIFIDEHNFVLVMVMSGNTVKTKNIKLTESVTDETVRQLGAALNRHLCGLMAEEITLPAILELEKEIGDAAGLVTAVVKIIYNVMNESDSSEMNLSGINRLLQYPEYNDMSQLKELMGTIENKEEIMNLVSKNATDDINVLIGSETTVKQLNNSSLVFIPIKRGDKTVGAVGIIGPVRMDYAKVVNALEGISSNIMDLLNSADGPGEGQPALNEPKGELKDDG
ncbi:MAG: hypothetical protein IJR83_01115, partial [Clostridia bacterium]|nr:hypothetical protein [Clostridia bacterium]